MGMQPCVNLVHQTQSPILLSPQQAVQAVNASPGFLVFRVRQLHATRVQQVIISRLLEMDYLVQYALFARLELGVQQRGRRLYQRVTYVEEDSKEVLHRHRVLDVPLARLIFSRPTMVMQHVHRVPQHQRH